MNSKNGARNYTDKTLKRLFALSGNMCAFPGCDRKLVNQKNALNSNICHIEAATLGGERFNPHMTDSDRADYENLILLCVQHHDETNDVERYPVCVLKEMKSRHEAQFLNQKINQNPSMLKNIIFAMSRVNLDECPDSLVGKLYDPAEKIRFNDLKRNSHLIYTYKVFQGKLNFLYDELESQGSLVKAKLLRYIRMRYEEVKTSYLVPTESLLDVVRKNSDDIFDAVVRIIEEKVENSGIFDEDVFLATRIIAVDAFIRCKILEEPSNDSE